MATKTSHSCDVVLKCYDNYLTERPGVSRLLGEIDPRSCYRLIDTLDLLANPRSSKVGTVTSEIEETLQENSELYRDMSKGLLIAAAELEPLDRNRYHLLFENLQLEGIVDGGHNCLAIARYLIAQAVSPEAAMAVRTWVDLKENWELYKGDIQDILEDCTFRVPVEIIFPGTSEAALKEWPHILQMISHARNNNAELKAEAKANHGGHFDYLREIIDPVLTESVEWKSGTSGHIKPRDLVMLALIPTSLVSPELGVEINPTTLYSSKGQCLKWYSSICEHKDVSKTTPDSKIKLVNPLIKNAFKIGMQFIDIYEELYLLFPEKYNEVSPGFGRIKLGKKKINRPCKTKFYRKPSEFNYPDGFLIPILWGMRALLEVDGEEIKWKVDDPIVFLNDHLESIMRVYHGMIKNANYDPQATGKDSSCYHLLTDLVEMQLYKSGAAV